MDRVRFGRALGYGARHAAQSLKRAADAASAPNPSATTSSRNPPAQRRSEAANRSASAGINERIVHTRHQLSSTRTHAKALGRSVGSPIARFSSVVWLQVTGTFFTLLALFLSEGLWKSRSAALHSFQTHSTRMFYLQLAAFLAFTYFAISNFVRAHLRGRR